MMPCDRIERKLVSGETLEKEESAHAGSCPQCAALSRTARALAASGPVLRATTDPDADEVRALAGGLEGKLQRHQLARWAWASATLALGLGTVMLVLLVTPAAVPVQAVDERLVTLVDDFTKVVQTGNADTGAAYEDVLAGVGFLDDDNDASTDELEAMVPRSYGLLNVALDSGWL